METHETRLCAEEQMEVEKSEESSATTAEENKDKSETSQSHEKTLGEEKLSSVIEESEKTPGSEELADNKKSPSSDNMECYWSKYRQHCLKSQQKKNQWRSPK